MKHIFFLFFMLGLGLGKATAQAVSKVDFQQHLDNFSNCCKQDNDYTADLGISHLNNSAKVELNRITTAITGQIAYQQNIVNAQQAIITTDSTRLTAFEAQVNKESGTQKVDDEQKVSIARSILSGKKGVLGKAKDKLFVEMNSYNEIQTDLNDIAAVENIKFNAAYLAKVSQIKTDQNKIITALNTFTATLE